MSAGLSKQQDVVVHAQAVLAHHAKSFRLASLFLPRDSSNDAAVVYSFCRLVDDAVDEAPNIHEAKTQAALLRAELKREVAPREEVAAFLDVAHRCGIPLYVAHDLMDGVCSDLGSVALQSQEELAQYCYRVAGTVGLMMCGVIGVQDPKAFPYAVDLGLGMQLTNICRDVLEDARRGRVYIPAEYLHKYGVGHEAILDESIDKEILSQIVCSMLDIAEHCYNRAYLGMRYIPAKTRLAILIALRVYRSIGRRLRRVHNGNAFHGRTIVPSWQKGFEVILGVGDFFSPRTWRSASRIPQSPLYNEWSSLRGLSSHPIQ